MKLAELLDELAECDKQERIELLLDYARSLPPLPERFEALRDPEHRVEECQSPVFLFAEKAPTGVDWFADVRWKPPLSGASFHCSGKARREPRPMPLPLSPTTLSGSLA